MSDYNFLKQAQEREQHAAALRKAHEEIDMLKREKATLETKVGELESVVTESAIRNQWDLSKDQKLSDLLKDYIAAHAERAFLTMFKIRSDIIETLRGQ